MNPHNRDLLVFTKKESDQKELEKQIELLNNLFHLVESSDAAIMANEIINVNRSKIITSAYRVRRILHAQQLKPFVFICNKN